MKNLIYLPTLTVIYVSTRTSSSGFISTQTSRIRGLSHIKQQPSFMIGTSRNRKWALGMSTVLGRSLTANSTLDSVQVQQLQIVNGEKREVDKKEELMRPPINWLTWDYISKQLINNFEYTTEQVNRYDKDLEDDKQALLKLFETMCFSRAFEQACNQQYMAGKIKGFMHLDNGQESIPAFVSYAIQKNDRKYSYYREHAHAIAAGVDAKKIMAELCMKDTGTCHGAGGSMHIFDKENYFQGGWSLVAEQLPYAAGAAKSLLIDEYLGLTDDQSGKKVQKDETCSHKESDAKLAVVFVGDGGAQNGRLPELLNAASKDNLPLLIVVIDNGRAINTFTDDVAANTSPYTLGKHYGIPGLLVNGMNAVDVAKGGKAVVDYIRRKGQAAILQVHTYRFMGHSPADPEQERGRKAEKMWAKHYQDPIQYFEQTYTLDKSLITPEELKRVKKEALSKVKEAVRFADDSPFPPMDVAKTLEYPDDVSTHVDYDARYPPSFADQVNARTISSAQNKAIKDHMDQLYSLASQGEITIAEAINLAIHEEMLQNPLTTMHAEDLQAGSSYSIPKLTQQTYGKIRAADEIIDEGHFIGKSIGEALNGYRPIVELMNVNFGIYAMPEISSAGNAYLQSGGQFKVPLTILGAGGTAPNQALGAEHSQPFHAYIMGIPGLKIATVASPKAAYGLTKSMIRDDGPCFMVAPVKMMKETKGTIDVDKCLPFKNELLHRAGERAVTDRKAVTVLTYLHGVKESLSALPFIQEHGCDIDLIELRALKPLDLDTIRSSLSRTNRVCILDESTKSGGVGATISARISEDCFDLLDAPVVRLCMEDTPVPYASTMERGVVKNGEDLVEAVLDICGIVE